MKTNTKVKAGLNPQPLPPGRSLTALNPQPLPPGKSGIVVGI